MPQFGVYLCRSGHEPDYQGVNIRFGVRLGDKTTYSFLQTWHEFVRGHRLWQRFMP